jgi:hypothetical protein
MLRVVFDIGSHPVSDLPAELDRLGEVEVGATKPHIDGGLLHAEHPRDIMNAEERLQLAGIVADRVLLHHRNAADLGPAPIEHGLDRPIERAVSLVPAPGRLREVGLLVRPRQAPGCLVTEAVGPRRAAVIAAHGVLHDKDAGRLHLHLRRPAANRARNRTAKIATIQMLLIIWFLHRHTPYGASSI